MENIELLRGRLRSAGLKATPQRISILSCVAASQAPVTAEAIFRRCPVGELNLSTVYRTLAALCRKGILSRSLRLNGAAEYYLEGAHHTHQALCLLCGKSTDLPECPLEALERSTEEQTGFLVTGHSLELTGICPECRKKSAQKHAKDPYGS